MFHCTCSDTMQYDSVSNLQLEWQRYVCYQYRVYTYRSRTKEHVQTVKSRSSTLHSGRVRGFHTIISLNGIDFGIVLSTLLHHAASHRSYPSILDSASICGALDTRG